MRELTVMRMCDVPEPGWPIRSRTTPGASWVTHPIGPTYCGLCVSLGAVALGGADGPGEEPQAVSQTSSPVVAATL
jgi:hypothetical protein